ncbi:RnfABCDGE type electron transport complex subunit B [Reinekea thalattae]|uniref:RnfABCDGE type electron transport complex subunit B n=1 Tax=Reinekea thalattae TaxID=2593301 RepID=A0A5C8Z6U5_9GAMM|nr:RnfABCDGE type electron transport complex subunit B [Reinekea thalattae]TXR53023.1 RnfABCDGE type electron transport complex subunit B [Reinekea thalattae]
MNITFSIIVFLLLGAALGAILGWAQKALTPESDSTVDELEAMLPGGQCGQCGEVGCRQAAEKMAQGLLSPNCCPPGGRALAASIASFLGIELGASDNNQGPVVAYIDEANCSGCGRCFKACPFDAIVGANRQMHTVMNAICTGCQLCEKACSQDCIEMLPVTEQINTWQWPKPQTA